MSRIRLLLTVSLGIAALALVSCGGGGSEGPLSSAGVRGCLRKGEPALAKKGLLFSVNKKEKIESYGEDEDFVGITVNELAIGRNESATISVVISNESEFLDAWEKEQLGKSGQSVDRVHNTVVTYEGNFKRRLAPARRWVATCLEAQHPPR